MPRLYIVQAQPNPPGKDTIRPGFATNAQLNEEWIELEAREGDRSLVGDTISHLTFSHTCAVTGQEALFKFTSGTLQQGHRIRLHTGTGTPHQLGAVLHMYVGRSWFVWNNACGDRATVTFQDSVVDSAAYAPRPREGVLTRIPGTDRLQ